MAGADVYFSPREVFVNELFNLCTILLNLSMTCDKSYFHALGLCEALKTIIIFLSVTTEIVTL